MKGNKGMTRKDVTINMASGLEARLVAMLVQVASQFDSSVYIDTEGKHVNAKSIMGMMSLALDKGSSITVVCDGSDEEEAVAGIENYLMGN